jgi:hypothetical protein
MSRRLAAESRDRGRGRRRSRQPRSARRWVATRQKPRTISVASEDLVRPERSSREVASDPRREWGRRRGWVGKVGKRAPTLETVATLVSPEASGKAIHTFMHFSLTFFYEIFVHASRYGMCPLSGGFVSMRVRRCRVELRAGLNGEVSRRDVCSLDLTPTVATRRLRFPQPFH